MSRLRIGFLLPTNKPHSLSLTNAAMRRLRDAGVLVEVLHPTRRFVDLGAVRVQHDLYVLKRTSGLAMSLAGSLHALGASIVNPYPASVTLQDKIATTRILRCAGLPIPASYIASDPEELAPLLEAGPLIIKPYQGASGYGIQVVRTPAELDAVQVQPKQPVFAQRYHPPDGRDRKLYNIGGRVFGVMKVFPARTEGEKHGEPFEPTAAQRDLVLKCGEAFGIDLYGVDIIESEGASYVVDMSSMPGFKGVPEAARLLADYFCRAASAS